MFRNIFIALAAACAVVNQVHGHGRLMDPPGRSSMWRFSEFGSRGLIPNYQDNELFCGGFQVQYEINGGNCGICGDAYHLQRPRDNENGGLYGKGIITRQYIEGQTLTIDVELTASHKGHFEFKICKLENSTDLEQPECFDENILQLAQGGTKFPVAPESGHYYPTVILPSGLTCDHCVLQWHYSAGNNWGWCGDGTGAVGCGPQETFRGCADIAIRPMIAREQPL